MTLTSGTLFEQPSIRAGFSNCDQSFLSIFLFLYNFEMTPVSQPYTYEQCSILKSRNDSEQIFESLLNFCISKSQTVALGVACWKDQTLTDQDPPAFMPCVFLFFLCGAYTFYGYVLPASIPIFQVETYPMTSSFFCSLVEECND